MKRSAAKTSRRRKPLTFYVDECLGRFVADALAADGFDVRPYYEHFAGRRDIEWLPEVGELRWIVLTKDKNIRRRQLEVDAILNANVCLHLQPRLRLRGVDNCSRSEPPSSVRKVAVDDRLLDPHSENFSRTTGAHITTSFAPGSR
jgi:PIN like domain